MEKKNRLGVLAIMLVCVLFCLFVFNSCDPKSNADVSKTEALEQSSSLEEDAVKEGYGFEKTCLEEGNLALISGDLGGGYFNGPVTINIKMEPVNLPSMYPRLDSNTWREAIVYIHKALYDGKTADEYLDFILTGYQSNVQFGMGGFEGRSLELKDYKDKYLYITDDSYFGGGSSFHGVSLRIFDVKLPGEITKSEIFIDTKATSFQQFVLKYLSMESDYDSIDQNAFFESLDNHNYGLSYEERGIILSWEEWQIGTIGSQIILPYSEVQVFLTPLGREIFSP